MRPLDIFPMGVHCGSFKSAFAAVKFRDCVTSPNPDVGFGGEQNCVGVNREILGFKGLGKTCNSFIRDLVQYREVSSAVNPMSTLVSMSIKTLSWRGIG